MDKLTIVLSDKTTVSELAKDPDVSIKIKDAILDGVMRRLTPVTNAVAHAVINDILQKDRYDRDTAKLTKRWEKVLRFKVAEVVSSELNTIIKDEINEAKEHATQYIKDWLDKIDIEKLVKECVGEHLANGVIIATK